MTPDLETKLQRLSPGQRARLLEKLGHPSSEASLEKPPVSFQQEQFYILEKTAAPAAYNGITSVRIQGALQEDVLQKSLDWLVSQHTIFRQSYVVDGDRLTTKIADTPSVSFEKRIWQKSSDRDFEAWATRQLVRLARKPFDLSRDCPLRALLLEGPGANSMLGLVVHHIAADGISKTIMWEKLSQAYSDLAKKKIPPATPSSEQYTAYAQRQQKRLSPEYLRSASSYWRRLLSDYVPYSELFRQVPSAEVAPSGSVTKTIPAGIFLQAQNTARAHHTTPNAVFLGAYFVFLRHLTKQRDLLCGLPAALRPGVHDHNVIGSTIATFPVRLHLDDHNGFDALLQQLHEQLQASMAYAEYPPQKLMQDLRAEISEATTLYSTLFQYRFFNAAAYNFGPCTAEPLEDTWAAMDVPFQLEVVPTQSFANVRIKYHPALFSIEEVDQFADQYVAFVEVLLKDPRKPLDALDFRIEEISASDQKRLVEWNATDSPLSGESFVELFEKQVEKSPQDVAAVCANQSLTYHDLNARANQLAHHFIQAGIGADCLIGICLERSLDMIIGVLATLKAGAAYVPMDPAYPTRRLAFMIQDAELSLVLTQHDVFEKLKPVDVKAVYVDDVWSAGGTASTHNPPHRCKPENLAYVVYTSGSTGQPKGSLVEHRGLSNLLSWYVQALGPSASLKNLVVTSFSFDLTQRNLLTPLICGGTVHLTPPGPFDGVKAVDIINTERIAVLNCTPSLFNVLVETGGHQLHSLKEVILGGEALLVEPIREWLASCKDDVWVTNAYGPSECSDVTITCRVRAQEAASLHSFPIGRPIPNVRIYMLNDSGALCAIGEPGELCIAGESVGRGYLKREKLTREKFVEVELLGRKERIYKTGDLARWSPEGQIEFLGRLDDQVKIRGNRIELAEIDAVLSACPVIHQSCTCALTRSDNGQMLWTALVVAEQAETNVLDTVRSYAEHHLPAYMQPSQWMVLDSLPLNRNGKVDRQALTRIGQSTIASETRRSKTYEVPIDDREQQLAVIWRDILGHETIGRHDNFFGLGGDSLQAIRMIMRVSAGLNVHADVRLFVQNPTLSALAESLNTETEAPRSINSTTEHINRQTTYPASYQQEYFWTLQNVLPQKEALTYPLLLHMRGSFHAAAFEAAFNELVKEHTIYHTVYDDAGRSLKAHVNPACIPQLEVLDLTAGVNGPSETPPAELLRERYPTFDLTNEAPIQAVLAQQTEHEYWLLICMHHIASDGDAWTLFWRDLRSLYVSKVYGTPRLTPIKTSPYANFALHQHTATQHNKAALNYWVDALKDAAEPPQPDHEIIDSEAVKQTACQVFHPLDAELLAHVKAYARDHSSTVHNVFLAAFFAWQYRYFAQEDITIGTPANTRLLHGGEEVHGCTITMFPIRQRLDAQLSFDQLQANIAESMRQALGHSDFSILSLIEHLAVHEQRATPLFHSIFQLRNLQDAFEALDEGCHVKAVHLPRFYAQLPLLFEAHPDAQAPSLSLTYDKFRIRKRTAETMLSSLHNLLQHALQAPQTTTPRLRLTDDAEWHQLTHAWACPITVYPREKTVVHIFQETCQAYPEKIALEWDGGSWTYVQLAQEAARVAETLRERGMERGNHVGICMPRSPEMIASMLGVLSCGGTYVPLDPNYPKERLLFMVQDAGLAAILTEHKSEDILQGSGAAIISYEDIPNTTAPAWSLAAVASSDPAYLMYTSGSTGQPKASIIPHRGIVRLVKHTNYLSFTPENVFLHLASPSFDASTFEIWGPLLNGGKLALMSAGTPSLSDIGRAIEEYHVTTLWLTAGLFHAVVDEAIDILKPLKELLVGGDVLSPQHMQRCQAHHPHLTLVNGYGPTENTTFSCCYTFPKNGETGRDVTKQQPAVPIGKPIANSEAYVLDAHVMPCPVGVPGELYLGGDGLSLGYWKRPQLNERHFIKHPFRADADARLYRSGDRARFLPDGNIEFLGRYDGQIKVRGFRVELSEIEHVLNQCPSIERCSAFAIQGSGNTHTVWAAIVSSRDTTSDIVHEAKAFSEEHLPTYMQPSRWLELPELPLTTHGKVDKRELQAKALKQDQAPNAEAIPIDIYTLNVLERRILACWQQVFPNHALQLDDNFFDLGGHSLQAMRLIALVERELNGPVPLNTLFAHPTLASFFKALAQNGDPFANAQSLFRLAEGTSAKTLILAHGVRGELFELTPIRNALKADTKIYGFQAREFSEGKRHERLATLCRDYAQEIAHAQLTGPVLFFGYSIGGIIAFETARQAQELGVEVERVIIVDTIPKNLPQRIHVLATVPYFFKRLSTHARGAMKSRKHLKSFIRKRLVAMNNILQTGGMKLEDAEKVPGFGGMTARERQNDHYVKLTESFYPKPARLAVTLIQSNQTIISLTPGWRYLARTGLRVVNVDVHHLEMLSSENAQTVAQIIEKELA